MNFNAVGRRLVVQVTDHLVESETGVITGEKQKPDRGVIVAVGHQVDDPAVKEGKIAVFNEYSGKEYKEGKNRYILLDVGEIYITKNP